jgi:aminoglycoside phosphotransferase (APT) family kinase protein
VEFASLEPLEGGWSGETFLAEAGGERTVVRIYGGTRGPAAHEIDAAVLRLVRGLLPVPEVLEVRRGSGEMPALLVTEFLPGVRGDLLLPTLDADGLRRAGESVGRVAAALGGMPLLARGVFADGDLTVEPFELELPESLGELGVAAEALLDEETRTCLVHSDLNPKNLLFDPDTIAITAVLDWEFAHAGHPFTDLGNVLRFDREPAYVDAVLASYADLRGTPPERALELARAADLYALCELASRAGQNPVATRAAVRLEAIVAAGDVHATERLSREF